jgi:RNA binding exosome subunit
MLSIKNITLTCISYITEEEELVKQALLNCLPEKLRTESLRRQLMQSQFGDKLIYFTCQLEKSKAKQTISHITQRLNSKSMEFLLHNIETRIDLQEKSFFLRLDKFKAVSGDLSVTGGSDTIRIELKYNAYTQEQNSMSKVLELLDSVGVAEHDS